MTKAAGNCLYCETPLSEREPGERVVSGVHGDCGLLHTVGHTVGLCGCTNYEGLTERAAAIECQRRYFQEGRDEPI